MAKCNERKRNSHVPDFDCRKQAHGRGESHVDTRTGVSWNHPSRGLPYGVKHPPRVSSSSTKAKHGVYYSTKDVKGYVR